MATLELARLSDHLEDEQIAAIQAAVAEHSEEVDFSTNEDRHVIDDSIDDDVFVDFRDRLEANDLDAEVYVPMDFEDVVQVGGLRVGSLHALQLVLDSLRDDFLIEDTDGAEFETDDEADDFDEEIDEEDEAEGYYADEDDGIEMKDAQLRHVWRQMYKATREAVVSNLSLFLHG